MDEETAVEKVATGAKAVAKMGGGSATVILAAVLVWSVASWVLGNSWQGIPFRAPEYLALIVAAVLGIETLHRGSITEQPWWRPGGRLFALFDEIVMAHSEFQEQASNGGSDSWSEEDMSEKSEWKDQLGLIWIPTPPIDASNAVWADFLRQLAPLAAKRKTRAARSLWGDFFKP